MRVLCKPGPPLESRAPHLNEILRDFPEPEGSDCFVRVEAETDGFSLVFVARNPNRSLASFSERLPWENGEPAWKRVVQAFLEENASRASEMARGR